MSWERSKLEEAENSTPLPSSEGWWGCRDRELWLPQLNLTQTSRHGKRPSDPPHLQLSSRYLQPSLLDLRGRKIHLAFANGCDSMQRRVSAAASLAEPWELLVP